MFGECHAHMIMDGVNYKKAVAQHKDGVVDAVIRQSFEEYTKKRDSLSVWREMPAACQSGQHSWPVNTGSRTGHLFLRSIRGGITVVSSACLFRTFQSTGTGLAQVRAAGRAFY